MYSDRRSLNFHCTIMKAALKYRYNEWIAIPFRPLLALAYFITQITQIHSLMFMFFRWPTEDGRPSIVARSGTSFASIACHLFRPRIDNGSTRAGTKRIPIKWLMKLKFHLTRMIYCGNDLNRAHICLSLFFCSFCSLFRLNEPDL